MQKQEAKIVFDEERASTYDERTSKLAPVRDALHFLMRFVLAELREDARILCVGAGTGAEVISLAQTFPHWHFTGVEPAPAMLDVCRRRIEECGLAERCTLHEGYLDSLPATEPFDAATCLLVSHFLTRPDERRNFFRKIAARLRPDGFLVSADLVAEMSSAAYDSLLEVWLRMLRHSEITAEQLTQLRDSYGRDVALVPREELESLISSSGFAPPVWFLQTLLIHACYANRDSVK